VALSLYEVVMFVFVLLFSCSKKTSETTAVEQSPIVEQQEITHLESKFIGTVILDGKEVSVSWDDGDTFSLSNPDGGKDIRARLSGFNTLESYGPVHQWGEWTESELFLLSKKAGSFSSLQSWNCTDTKSGGGYGRVLVDCPAFKKAILEAGLAHPFNLGTAAPIEDLEAMQKAINEGQGIWAKGVPKFLITSLHSQDEKPDKDAYNRICDISSGECSARSHTDVYETCQKVCIEDSCMLYVPYSSRYGGNKAECLSNQTE